MGGAGPSLPVRPGVTLESQPAYAEPRSLRQLFDAVIIAGSNLDLESVLRHIVESAVALVDARYGALGVLDESGKRLPVHHRGPHDETYRAIGTLPGRATASWGC